MISRHARVRSTIAVLLVSLVALWGVAVYATASAGLRLWSVDLLDNGVSRPANALVTALQLERRLAAERVAGASPDATAARAATDAARAELDQAGGGTLVGWARSEELDTALDALSAGTAQLATLRRSVDAAGPAAATQAGYTALIDLAFRVLDLVPQAGDDGRTVIGLTRARELLAREDALVSGRLAATAATTLAETGQLTGGWRSLLEEQLTRLAPADRAAYDRIRAGAQFLQLNGFEGFGGPAVTAQQWRAAVDPVLDQVAQANLDLRSALRQRLLPSALVDIGALLLVVALGFVALFASLNISIITARRLRALRDAADDLAVTRLPSVVDRLGRGERVDVSAEAPPLEAGRDEIGQVSAAFNRMQETAVRVAIEQAELRRGVRDVFLSLARRSQALLHRQLGQLDAMERRAGTPDELAELFRVDHLATRMRRNAENLIVLSGAAAGRTWRKPVPMIDVMRGALAEVEDFSRVTVLPTAPAALIGPAVGNVIHLLAELIENAVSFSPPQTTVRVGGARVGHSFVIEVEDRGLGMSETQRSAANQALRQPPEFTLAGTARLGLYVVGRLAERHQIEVELRPSPYGGTTAVVVLPGGLVTSPVPSVTEFDPPDLLAPVGARPKPGGPTHSAPVSTAASGLPVRRRPTESDATTSDADLLPGRPASGPGRAASVTNGRAVATPLPGMDRLGGGEDAGARMDPPVW